MGFQQPKITFENYCTIEYTLPSKEKVRERLESLDFAPWVIIRVSLIGLMTSKTIPFQNRM